MLLRYYTWSCRRQATHLPSTTLIEKSVPSQRCCRVQNNVNRMMVLAVPHSKEPKRRSFTEGDDETNSSLHTNIAHVTVHSSVSMWDTAQSVAV
jgi:hypothetical protein